MSLKRVQWACRRGMLELDLFLIPFAESVYNTLSSQEQSLFWQLLEESDTDLQQWLVHQGPLDKVEYLPLLAKIRDFKKNLSH